MNKSSNKPRFHKICLHGPWQFEVAARDGKNSRTQNPTVVSSNINLPGKLDRFRDDSLAVQVNLLRSFGCPTGLTVGQKVWLVVESTNIVGQVYLNGNGLDELNREGLRSEIRQLLQPRNALRIVVDLQNKNGTAMSIQSVRLEIEEFD